MKRERDIRRTFSAFVLVAAGCLVFGSGALAQQDQKTVQVNATVAKYAAVTVTQPFDNSMKLGTFNGTKNAERPVPDDKADATWFTVETNTKVNIVVDGTDLTHVSDPSSTITTGYWVMENGAAESIPFHRDADNNYAAIGQVSLTAQEAKTITTYDMFGRARLGNVSSQQAGQYEATITMTVSAAP
ncbi:MAG: hypothetical protein WC291_07005 [Thermodesulfovibrionales bacterium]|jgi:hypothetical protein